ncbi:MAG: hypothetical protein K9M57_07935 [Phycisphaerae bacterium]|nr:hypothetical protein [Phycisphaerae bacterium]
MYYENKIQKKKPTHEMLNEEDLKKVPEWWKQFMSGMILESIRLTGSIPPGWHQRFRDETLRIINYRMN